MDLSTDFVCMKKLLMSAKVNYKNPHVEAMRMKYLWRYDDDALNVKGSNEKKLLLNKYQEDIMNLIENSIDDLSINKCFKYLKKALYIDPTYHKLYAIKANIYEIKSDWKRSITCYETARRMLLKYEKNSKDYKRILKNYKKKLINIYSKRGKFYEDDKKFIESIADYEEILTLAIGENIKKNFIQLHQDNLLNCLRKLDKYESYLLAWSEFIKSAGPERRSYLLTEHAEFKINNREISSARKMLEEAICLNENNEKAEDLLEVIFDTGQAMLSNSIIWCITGYYEKALATIEKSADCDPYNRGLTILKTIVLRISGRFREAFDWLEWVDKNFGKFFSPSNNDDKRESVIGNFTLRDTREALINQWHLIRYDMALEFTINGRYEEALNILRNDEYLLKKYSESWLLIGDCLIRSNCGINELLRVYKKANEERNGDDGCKNFDKMKIITISQRIAEILNTESLLALQNNDYKKAREKAEDCFKILFDKYIPDRRLGSQKSEAIMYMARSYCKKLQTAEANIDWMKKLLAESLSFCRGADDGDLKNVLLGGGKTDFDKTIKYYSSNDKRFPFGRNILMQN